jgi:hypothetical protein
MDVTKYYRKEYLGEANDNVTILEPSNYTQLTLEKTTNGNAKLFHNGYH